MEIICLAKYLRKNIVLNNRESMWEKPCSNWMIAFKTQPYKDNMLKMWENWYIQEAFFRVIFITLVLEEEQRRKSNQEFKSITVCLKYPVVEKTSIPEWSTHFNAK